MLVQTFDGGEVRVPREPGNEIVAELLDVTEEPGGRLVGTDKVTGLPSTWVVEESSKPCRGCS